MLASKKEDTEHMNPKIAIRRETDADMSAITEVTAAAFKTLEISNHTEQFIIEALRAATALTVSLVAEVDGSSLTGRLPYSSVASSWKSSMYSHISF
jgi:putative acetyltransferase